MTREPASVTRPAPPVESDGDYARKACARIAPCWPLDQFIAVNPLWGMVGEPLESVATRLMSLSGAQWLMPREWYRNEYREGRLQDRHLQAAIDMRSASITTAELKALLERPVPAVAVRSRVVDILDRQRNIRHEVSWRRFITHNVSQFCAAYFDEGQAQLGPDREGGLYASWLRSTASDHSPSLLMGDSSIRGRAQKLPGTAAELVSEALDGLSVAAAERESYLWSLLLDQNGWASWCAYRRWMAGLRGEDDDTLLDLLAIRLAWEWMLFNTADVSARYQWTSAMTAWRDADRAAAKARPDDWLLQLAMENAWREPVEQAICEGFEVPRPADPSVQAVFCIDVRSEVFRRALEATTPKVQTLGFAGFFGMPIDYLPAGTATPRTQLPGLLAPRMRATDLGLDGTALARREATLGLADSWKSFATDPLGSFTFVEAMGITFAGKLLRDSLGLGEDRRLDQVGLTDAMEAKRRPRLVGAVDGEPIALDARCDLAAGVLRSMSLTRVFARVVLLSGHGSLSRNNPHAAGLDCGACCGQTGEVNARVAAALLNEPAVRAGLRDRGIDVPATTVFVAGLHNTTTDELTLFDLDEVPSSHASDLDTLRGWLQLAGEKARAERARLLGIETSTPTATRGAFLRRSKDWAQVRPEWGLANNAAFIVAPREHCRHLDLQGRSFLHEYRHQEDADYQILEAIMTAPMVVTHWINLQYYASTVDNARYGSGNKVLHNVVGGHIGVFEGNGGDLRTGLAMQSLHDGERWVHTPLRLSVYIEAPRMAIDGVLAKHDMVRDLVTKGWVSLHQLDEVDGGIHDFRNGVWCKTSQPGVD